jgi:hypothetical protein
MLYYVFLIPVIGRESLHLYVRTFWGGLMEIWAAFRAAQQWYIISGNWFSKASRTPGPLVRFSLSFSEKLKFLKI